MLFARLSLKYDEFPLVTSFLLSPQLDAIYRTFVCIDLIFFFIIIDVLKIFPQSIILVLVKSRNGVCFMRSSEIIVNQTIADLVIVKGEKVINFEIKLKQNNELNLSAFHYI